MVFCMGLKHWSRKEAFIKLTSPSIFLMKDSWTFKLSPIRCCRRYNKKKKENIKVAFIWVNWIVNENDENGVKNLRMFDGPNHEREGWEWHEKLEDIRLGES